MPADLLMAKGRFLKPKGNGKRRNVGTPGKKKEHGSSKNIGKYNRISFPY